MASALPHQRWLVKHSKWGSRGWIHQEGLLSKRWLVFTDHQITYDCNGMRCTESSILPLGKLHVKSKKKSKVRTAWHVRLRGSREEALGNYVVAELSNRRCIKYYARNLQLFQQGPISPLSATGSSYSTSRKPFS
jgi:hypothetical protein